MIQDGELHLKNLNVLMQKEYFNGAVEEIESNYGVNNFC